MQKVEPCVVQLTSIFIRRRPNELNNKAELEALAEIIKQINYSDSNPVYRDINNYDKKMIDIIIENVKDIRIFNGDNRM